MRVLNIQGRAEANRVLRPVVGEDNGSHRRFARPGLAHEKDFLFPHGIASRCECVEGGPLPGSTELRQSAVFVPGQLPLTLLLDLLANWCLRPSCPRLETAQKQPQQQAFCLMNVPRDYRLLPLKLGLQSCSKGVCLHGAGGPVVTTRMSARTS